MPDTHFVLQVLILTSLH